MKPKRQYIQPLATLQFAAVIAIVLTHFWLKNGTYLQALCTSFCFVYSGFFTALTHRDERQYRLADHIRFMRDKLAKLYPLHVLALGLSLLVIYIGWHYQLVFSKMTLAHLLLISPWFTTPSFYFGLNPVSWFICDLFFLYLISPWLIRGLRHFKLGWQIAIVGLLIVGELVAGYATDPGSPSLLIPNNAHYYLYEFPLIRVLDFTTGIVLYHLTLTHRWRAAASRLTPTRATLIEMCAIGACVTFYPLGEKLLHPHWYRAFCSMAPIVVIALGAVVFTSGNKGFVSLAMCMPPLPAMSRIGAEVYLLQFGAYHGIRLLVNRLGLPSHGALYFLIQMGGLLLLAWAVHHYVTTPLYRHFKSHEHP